MLVILYNQGSALHTKWSKQVVDADKRNAKRIGMNGAKSTIQLVQTITDAAIAAGFGGHLVFAVGHGGTQVDPLDQGLADGFVDLAPDKKLRLGTQQGDFTSPFYDTAFQHERLVANSTLRQQSDKENDERQHFPGYKTHLANWQVYQNISMTMRMCGVGKVTFLTCRIGKSRNFVKRIALDWGVVVHAYEKYVWIGDDTAGKTRVYLDGDKPGAGTNIPAAALQLPAGSDVLVGPPR